MTVTTLHKEIPPPSQTDHLAFACDFSFSDFIDVNSYNPALTYQPYAPNIDSQNKENEQIVCVHNDFQVTY